MAVKMTRAEAADYAPQWGSYMRAGDPGACMYGAIPPESADDAREMLEHIETHCMPIAKGPDADSPDDEIDLIRLSLYLESLFPELSSATQGVE